MMNSYVYTLVDPRNSLPFYVGKGSGERCNAHVVEAKYYVKRKSPKLNKIRKLMRLGMEPIVIKLEENVSDKQALDLECLLIAEMRDLGFKLTNMTDGGDGAQGYKHTEEYKQMMSQRFKGRIITEEHRQKMCKPKSEQGRKNIALARLQMDYRPTDEHKRKTSEALKGRLSPMTGRTHTDDARAKMSAIGKGRPKPKVECPHCQKAVAVNTAKRWHFDNCKDKE
jgi:hypothetical protein